ncbi:hypothetical protein BS78_02G148200, partial [Paspalum vaginatum]
MAISSPAASPWFRSKGRMTRSADKRESREADSFLKEEEVVPPSDAAMEEEEEEREGEKEEGEEVSFAPSSPLCRPYIQRELVGNDSSGESIYMPTDSETFRAYEEADAKYREKLARKWKLPTLDTSVLNTCLDDPKLIGVRELASKSSVRAGRFVFSLSSSICDEPLNQCTGILVDWDSQNDGTGFILTSAHLICSKCPSLDSWLCKDEYACAAKTIQECHLLYLQKHYNIALFSTKMKHPCELPSFSDDVDCGDHVLFLGRDEKANIRISYGEVQHVNPNLLDRYHFMYTYGADDGPKCGAGGPVIDFDAKVLGISNGDKQGSFVPASIVLKWLHLWRNYGCIPRPHLQLKLWAVKFLDPIQIRILAIGGKDDGLVVKEVSNGSFAEKLGLQIGDIIECLNGKNVSSTVELENMLLGLSENYLDKRNGDNAKIDVEIGVFCTQAQKRRTIAMVVNVSDDGEEVVR